MDGELGEDLAIHFNARAGETVYEAAVGDAAFTHGGVDALDPEGAEGALLVLAVAIGVLHRLVDGGLCGADGVLAAAIEALGGIEGLLMLGMGCNATFDASHS